MVGIYKVVNNITGGMYIGESTNIERRISEHKNKPFSSKRQDDLDKKLYQAIRKYGIENFSFEVIEECSKEQLKDKEIYWIRHYNTYDNPEHYNNTPGGDLPCDSIKHVGEKHGMSKLTQKDVEFCRECYASGLRSRDIYEKHFKNRINWGGFERMWHGQTWKEVKPEVFKTNPHRASYGEKDKDIITKRYNESGLSLRGFSKSEECYVGYATLHNMINNPSFYDGK